jgi:DNA polymerase-3 subunit gamma/tau
VQLYYQIALHGRNDLALAPDEYAGFTMTLLRMLAFAPRDEARPMPRAAAAPAGASANGTGVTARADAAPAARAATRPQAATGAAPKSAASTASAVPASALPTAAQWPQFVAGIQVVGLARELAAHSELLGADGDHFRLRVPIKSYAEPGNVERLRAALTQHFGRPVRVSVEVGSTAGATAAALAEQARSERQKSAEQAILSDPFVQELIENFGAQVEPQSIRPSET